MATKDRGDFQWSVQAGAATWIGQRVGRFCESLPALRTLGERMLAETGTRLVDWVDHLSIRVDDSVTEELSRAGFCRTSAEVGEVWLHEGGMFPRIRPVSSEAESLVVKVESVDDFLFAHRLSVPIAGEPLSQLRRALVEERSGCRFEVLERHGTLRFAPIEVDAENSRTACEHAEAFLLRPRRWQAPGDGFEATGALVDAAVSDLGTGWASELFFAAERRYWQSRNRAARVQRRRQDRLGLGWANHDHHTYRCSREHFAALVLLLEKLGLRCRERFYGGAEAGWGAQVLEQPDSGVVVFADVDLTPEEVIGDFAHQGLPPWTELGTVGLWCCLHGEAVLEAGMHHLECQFDFDAARKQLAEKGIETMAPFTDFPHLKQAFTRGEVWEVDPVRVERAVQRGAINDDQASRFRESGSIGSHLEILERNGGYKGFNQQGISEIIRQTDPRRLRTTGPTG